MKEVITRIGEYEIRWRYDEIDQGYVDADDCIFEEEEEDEEELEYHCIYENDEMTVEA